MKNRDVSIILPENPFWKVFKRFGRDEMISLIFNVIGTVIIAYIIKQNQNFSEGFKIFLISIAGPIVEKIGFYPAHLYEGWKEWKLDKSKKLGKCLWSSFKNGSVSLLEDLLIHDPVYIGLMYLGQTVYIGTPEWLLAFSSFIIAVIVVSIAEVSFIELMFKRFKYSLGNKFKKEKYYESRFYVDYDHINPDTFIQKISKKFDLDSRRNYWFEDIYYKAKLSNYNGRIGKVRKRIIEKEEGCVIKYQITYTKAGEIPQQTLSQYRFFINEKEKFITDIEKNSLKYCNTNIFSSLRFIRKSALKKDGLYAAIDTVINGNKYAVIELKVFNDLELIKSAMKFIMDEFNVIQTTHGKSDIVV